MFPKALASLRKYPLKLKSAKECQILNGFGVNICNILDQKLQEFAEMQSLPTTEALTLANSLPTCELAKYCAPKVNPEFELLYHTSFHLSYDIISGFNSVL